MSKKFFKIIVSLDNRQNKYTTGMMEYRITIGTRFSKEFRMKFNNDIPLMTTKLFDLFSVTLGERYSLILNLKFS